MNSDDNHVGILVSTIWLSYNESIIFKNIHSTNFIVDTLYR